MLEPAVTKNYGLAGGTLDATKHIELARDPAAYMAKLAENAWAQFHNARREVPTAATTMDWN